MTVRFFHDSKEFVNFELFDGDFVMFNEIHPYKDEPAIVHQVLSIPSGTFKELQKPRHRSV